ncbi:MAG TPA: hypothetical protein VM008_21825 [Phycisphaerae bacterium]|nr:hypothetical protein [Phycisphaerae bacterium]
MVTKTPLTGTVHGKTVELDHYSGLPDGTRVKVEVDPQPRVPSVESLRRAFGGWAGDDEAGLDAFLAQLREARHAGHRPDPAP